MGVIPLYRVKAYYKFSTMLYVALFALLSLASASDRIINGVDVESTSVAPWQVSLQHSGSHFCGGSLIAAGYVMSACHCKQNTGANVVMGTIYTDQPKYQVHGMFTCHPSYNSRKNDYDYSILTLASEVDVTDPDLAVIPIAAKEYPGGMAAQITGWGMTNSHINRLPTQLQLADTNLVSQEDCRAYWGVRRITDRMQCIGGNGINSGCMGDSGGPLVVVDPDDGVTYLVGNTSFGTSDCSTSAPGMWSKNVVVKDWIEGIISA